MNCEIKLSEYQALKMVPFLTSVLVYFTFVRNSNGDLTTTLMKCAPIVFLMMYILLKGFKFTRDYKYSQRILLGLGFSCAGDALLNFDLFPHGMAAFAAAQIFYISAFTWKPLKPSIGISLYLVGIAMVAVILKFLDDILVFGLPVYAVLLLTMCWRAMARAVQKNDFLSTLCAIGSVFFVISDGLISIDMFIVPIPSARIYIMSTYYCAQFCIALSTASEIKLMEC